MRCLLMIGALVLAAATLAAVEKPIMRSSAVRGRVAAGIAVGLIGTISASSAAMGVGSIALNRLASGAELTTTTTFASAFGQDNGRRSGPVRPTALQAKSDIPARDCNIDGGTQVPDNCTFGVPGATRVVLFGDSHAHQWQPALEQIAQDRNWELVVRAKAGCPVPALAPRPDQSIRFSRPECAQWREAQLLDIVNNVRPAMVFVSSFSMYVPDRSEILAAWNASLDRLRVLGVPIVYIRDTPFPNREVPECISSALDDWTRCDFPRVSNPDREPVITQTIQGFERHVSVIDLNAYLCPAEQCPAARNGTLLYRDDSHITASVAKLLAPAVDQALVDAKLVASR